MKRDWTLDSRGCFQTNRRQDKSHCIFVQLDYCQKQEHLYRVRHWLTVWQRHIKFDRCAKTAKEAIRYKLHKPMVFSVDSLNSTRSKLNWVHRPAPLDGLACPAQPLGLTWRCRMLPIAQFISCVSTIGRSIDRKWTKPWAFCVSRSRRSHDFLHKNETGILCDFRDWFFPVRRLVSHEVSGATSLFSQPSVLGRLFRAFFSRATLSKKASYGDWNTKTQVLA